MLPALGFAMFERCGRTSIAKKLINKRLRKVLLLVIGCQGMQLQGLMLVDVILYMRVLGCQMGFGACKCLTLHFVLHDLSAGTGYETINIYSV